MLHSIKLLFPVNDEKTKVFYKFLIKVLELIPNADSKNEAVVMKAICPEGALPATIIDKSSNNTVGIQFSNKNVHYDELNNLINTLFKYSKDNQKEVAHISILDFYRKVSNHIVRIDHTGFNIPSSMPQVEWNKLIDEISKVSAIYSYPTGEDWLFIIPSIEEEFNGEISSFCIGREPKFELVYDHYSSVPTFQFDIETDLSQQQVEALFPEPIGQSFVGLEAFFRAVYIQSPYSNIMIRFDIRFKNTEPGNDWQTGRWLIKEGKRISS